MRWPILGVVLIQICTVYEDVTFMLLTNNIALCSTNFDIYFRLCYFRCRATDINRVFKRFYQKLWAR
jgi:hypothetical protein